MDRLTKSTHFLAVQMSFTLEELCQLYIMRLSGYIECQSLSYRTGIPDFGTLLEEFLEDHGDAVNDEHRFFYPQTDGQSNMTIQVLEDMLRACVLNLKGSWEEHLPLVEFAYNNSYQASIRMAPYEALYGRPCRSPICWT